jgi:hypothetical protein
MDVRLMVPTAFFLIHGDPDWPRRHNQKFDAVASVPARLE